MTTPYNALRQQIGQNLYHARMAQKISLHMLARMTGIGLKKLDRYEMGNSAVRLEVLLCLAQALNVTVGMLLKEPAESVHKADHAACHAHQHVA